MNRNADTATIIDVPVSSVALLHIDELERKVARLTSDKEKIIAELKEKNNILLEKAEDLSLILSYMDEIDAQIEVSKSELLGTDTTSVTSSEATADEDLTAMHVKRMVDLISVLTNLKVQLSSRSNDLAAADQKIDELHSGIQSLQQKHSHLIIEYKKERDQLLSLSEEINQRNKDIERVEEENAVIYSKYQEVLESSLIELEAFRGELDDTLSQLQASNSRLAAMEADHQKELKQLKTDSEEARVEWSQKEGVYQKELSQLREAIRLLEEDKREALDRFGSGEENSRDEKSLLLSSSMTINSIVTSTTSSSSSTSYFDANGVATVGGGESHGLEWQEKERLYQKELSQMREAILQLETDRQDALLRLKSELDVTRDELQESIRERNRSMDASIFNPSRDEVEEELLEDLEEEGESGKGLSFELAPLAQRQLECEVTMLKEKLAKEALCWQEKEQQYVATIDKFQSMQDTLVKVETAVVAVEMPTLSSGMTKIGFFFRGVIATASVLFLMIHKDL